MDIKRVELNGNALVFRVFVDGMYEDRVFVRDAAHPEANNVWVQVSYRAFVDLLEPEGPWTS